VIVPQKQVRLLLPRRFLDARRSVYNEYLRESAARRAKIAQVWRVTT
jgi:hypothetical protein